jgi:glycyl-tRNA synthetase beta chain
MADLTFELGCEELPASAVERAADELCGHIKAALDESRIGYGDSQVLCTPRRLIVSITKIDDVQPDENVRQRGPSTKAAFDEAGEPTRALQGFCKGQGIDPADVETEGDYVWVSKVITGKPAIEVLASVLPESIGKVTFDKTMRWGSSRLRFARPIRWILASLDCSPVEFELEGVKAGLESRGHRFNSPEPFKACCLAELVQELRSREVEPDAAVRRDLIIKEANEVSGGKAILTDALIDENVHLTERPKALLGEFPEEYLVLPEPVLITAMAKHEKFFPVRGADGKLDNKFVSIWNGGEEAVVRRGNQWVLGARFNDAKFFYDEDLQVSMDDFLAKTEAMTFQESLGNVRKRSDRLAALTKIIAAQAGLKLENEAAYAGLYAKSDLSSGLVSELASLQGVIGGEYARREGATEASCQAIAQQYSLNTAPESTGDKLGVCLLCADQIDKLAGYLGLGLSPTGSSDPFGLRRASGLLLDAVGSFNCAPEGWSNAFDQALQLYADQGIEIDADKARELASDIFQQRVKASNTDKRHDIVEAALEGSDLAVRMDPKLMDFRLSVMDLLATNEPLLQAASRPLNIVDSAREKGEAFDQSLKDGAWDATEGNDLHWAAEEAYVGMQTALTDRSPEEFVVALQTLQAPIDKFFDAVMVMAEDSTVRCARIGLLSWVSRIILTPGDLRKIVIEG